MKFRYVFVIVSLILALIGDGHAVEIQSPNGQVRANVLVDDSGRLVYSLTRGDSTILQPSPMGITIDNVDLGQGVELGETQSSTINEKYPWRGLKSEAVDHCNVMQIAVKHGETGKTWTLETRAYDDGFAYRYIIPGTGERTVSSEATAWVLPDNSEVWYQTNIGNYEPPAHQKKTVAEVNEEAMALPVAVELADGTYAAITEGYLLGYSGMTLRCRGDQRLLGVFADDGWGGRWTARSVRPGGSP